MSLGDAVYQRLLAAILEGVYVSGDELSEVTLAEQFQVSRTPVRDALSRLAAEGLVLNGKNRRATVATFTRSTVHEIYELRGILEAAATRLATPRFDPAELKRLFGLADAVKQHQGPMCQEAALSFDMQLHRTIAQQCGNTRLQAEIHRATNFIPVLQRLAGRRDDRLQLAYDEHLKILAAIAAKDPDRASGAMAEHVASALRIVLEDVYPL
jgi:DNA-binding GntR family transcriptional regulator